VQWWRHRGPTDIGNLDLVRGRRHTEIHQAELWQLAIVSVENASRSLTMQHELLA
jgi:hypothetical protein